MKTGLRKSHLETTICNVILIVSLKFAESRYIGIEIYAKSLSPPMYDCIMYDA